MVDLELALVEGVVPPKRRRDVLVVDLPLLLSLDSGCEMDAGGSVGPYLPPSLLVVDGLTW